MLSTAQKVRCTHNFFFAAVNLSKPLDDYLRPVDAALLFADGKMLLLSEREADGILLAQSVSSSQPSVKVGNQRSSAAPKLIHLSYTLSEENEARIKTNPLMHAAKHRTRTACTTLAPVWVLSGWTTVPEHAKAAVKVFIKGGRRAVGHIVAARGHGHLLPRSDLERLLT